MPKIRYAVLVNDKSLTSTTTSGTETVDLPERGIATELVVQVTYTKTSSNDRPLPDFDAITKLEVLVDGSTVVKSLSGQEVRALMWYNKGPFSAGGAFWGAGGDTDCYTILTMYFGRFAGDTLYGLDLSKYANVQLKITFDTSTTSVDGLTYDAATSPAVKYNVMVKLLDGAPSGFKNMYVQSREIDNFTATASTEHNVEIPRGFDLKGLLWKSGYLNVTWTSSVGSIKLDFDNGQWVPIDMDHENIKAAFLSWFPEPVKLGWWDKAASADTVNLQVHQLAGMGSMSAAGSGEILYYDMHETGLHDIAKFDNAGNAITSQTNNHISVEGWGPMQSIYIPMGQLTDGSVDFIKTTDYGRIDLKITPGSSNNASQKGYVVAEYYKPNGS